MDNQPRDTDFRYRLPPELNIATASYLLPHIEFSNVTSTFGKDGVLLSDFTISSGGLVIKNWIQFEVKQLKRFINSLTEHSQDDHLGLGFNNGELTIVFNYYASTDSLKLYHFIEIGGYDRTLLVKALNRLLASATAVEELPRTPIDHPGAFLIPSRFDEMPAM